MNYKTLKPKVDSMSFLIEQIEIIEHELKQSAELGIENFDQTDIENLNRQMGLYENQLEQLIKTI